MTKFVVRNPEWKRGKEVMIDISEDGTISNFAKTLLFPKDEQKKV